jgi:hypothetical protein
MSNRSLSFVASGEPDVGVEQNDLRVDSLFGSDQLERDLAEIERAVVALRKAEPALEPSAEVSLEDPLAVLPPRPPSVWLLIGALWLLLALVAGCAVVTVTHWSPAHAATRSVRHASISVAVGRPRQHGTGDDLQVQPERPIVDIK